MQVLLSDCNADVQFVVFIELVGTCVLPAAIGFTIYVIVIAIVRRPIPIIPLCLLGLILGLPAVLIVLTAKRWSYVGWMIVYLFSLIIWNFVLPMYAFWNFDDFTWYKNLFQTLIIRGDTRRVEGELKGGALGEDGGEFDSSQIVMKRWAEFERDRRRKQIAAQQYPLPQAPIGVGRPPSSRGGSSNRGGYEMPYV
jgi:chitin synthase